MAKEYFSSLEELLKIYPKKDLGKAVNLTNKKYNRLTCLTRVDKKTSNTGASWACQCDCGKFIVALGSQIMSGHTSSCGCYNKELTKEICKEIGKQSYCKDYTKEKNPFYDFIESTGIRDKTGMIWVIKCKKCGEEYKEVPNQVISEKRNRGNNPCTCWKRNSKGELKIEKILTDNNIPFIKEYQFEDCLSPKGNPMKFDYFVNNHYLIEYDGQQHYFPINFGDSQISGEEKLKLYQEYDKIKNNYCLNNNISLIRIPYTHYNDLCIEDLLLKTSKFIIGEKDGK